MKNRVALWDNYKFFLILSVVVGHFIDRVISGSNASKSLFLFIYTFHIPAFMFVSGVFYSSRKIRSKVLFYISIGYLLKFVSSVINRLQSAPVYFSLLSDDSTPWFLFVLAIFYVLRYFLRDMNRWFVVAFSVILACFTGYDKSIGDMLYLSRTIVFFPFFLIGSYINATDLIMKIKHNKWCVAAAALVVLAWGWCCFSKLGHFYFLRPLLTGRNPFPDNLISRGPIYRAQCYLISSLVGAAILVLTPSRNIKYISVWGTRTINVFFWQRVIIKILAYHGFFRFCTEQGRIYALLVAVLVTVISSTPWFDFPIKQIKTLCFRRES